MASPRRRPPAARSKGDKYASAQTLSQAVAPVTWQRPDVERRIRELLVVGGDQVARVVARESGWEPSAVLSAVGDVVAEIARGFENSRPDHRALADYRLARLSESAWRGELVRNRRGRIRRVSARDPQTLEILKDPAGREIKIPLRQVDHALVLKIEAARMVVQGVDQPPPELPRANPETALQRSMRSVLDALTPEDRERMVEEARELERRAGGHPAGVRSIGHEEVERGKGEEDC